MRVTLLDTQTGETRIDERETIPFWWAEGNGSCDCNRMTVFGLDYGPDNVCVGSHRFLIVNSSDIENYSLLEYNSSYPKELLAKHLPPMNSEPATAVALEDAYKGALIGQSVHPDQLPRFVYSLNGLARIRSRQGNRSLDTARSDVMAMVIEITAQHGDRAPLFVDDAVSRPNLLKPESKIIVPGRFRA